MHSLLPNLSLPPVLSSMHLRFYCQAAGTITVTANSVLCLIVTCKTLTTAVQTIFSAARIRRIRMVDTNQDNPIGLEWLGGTSGASYAKPVNMVAVGNSQWPAIIDSRPPASSLTADWFTASITSNLFTVTCNSGSSGSGTYIDIWLDYLVGSKSDTPTTALNSNAPFTGIGMLPLDGAGATPSLPSVAPNAIN